MGLNLWRYCANKATHKPPFKNATFATIVRIHGLKNIHLMPLKFFRLRDHSLGRVLLMALRPDMPFQSTIGVMPPPVHA
jgi:hypothetical protein